MPPSQEMAATLRSLYRRLLRELPARQPSLLANPSAVQYRIRKQFSTQAPSSSTSNENSLSEAEIKARVQEGEQYWLYLKSQRLYTTLIERYNPGMNMVEEERVRLTAKRVGMEMPAHWYPVKGDGE